MQKIGNSTETANPSGEFTEGSPAGGTPSTLIKASWLNAVQRELLSVISGAGLNLDPNNDAQLLQAIQGLAGTAAKWANVSGKPATFPPSTHSHSWDSVTDKPTNFPVAWSSVGSKPQSVLGLSTVTSLTANATLTAAQMGLVTLDASAGARTFTLPAADVSLGVVDVIVRRTDNSGNRLVVQASGTDKIKFHTHLNNAGYAFLVLMGAGDWWHLRSDGAGNWMPLARLDSTPLGRPVFDTATVFSPGGYGALNGSILNRAEWPWLWDHAQASGMFTTEAARVGREGGWTSGDGVATFRGPEVRGEFLRVLDESRGVEANRLIGSSAADSTRSHFHYTDGTLNSHRHVITTGGDGVIDGGSSKATIYDGLTSVGTRTGDWGGIETAPRNIAYPGRLKLI
ncbi:phage tail protein [Pseudomonas sp. GV071]|uniref:phage tail protein n=1 Tax=Pseudomonas sp. GV071 TaxID=2135754 RepID=UPI000D4D2CCC|nr:phage tail protein [Pseudomonas sp. GV071]PTQ68132.1 hypothetical protein C8K61_11248 [Pseudomonas sp. GV071]